MFFLGGAVGNLGFGFLSDSVGRYPTFVLTNVVCMITGIVTPYCKDVYSFTAIRFVMELTHSTYFGTIYLLGKREMLWENSEHACSVSYEI